MKKTSLENWIFKKIGSRDIEDYQLRKLKENINYVKNNSRFYKEQLRYINENDINSFEDFEKVPFTTAEDIKDNPLRFLCVSQQYISRIVSLNTSGTTGKSKRIFFTEEDQELTIDFFKEGMKDIVNSNDRVLILLPGEISGSVGDLLKKALSRINVESYIQGPIKDVKEVSNIIKLKNINSLVGIPVQVISLSRKEKEVFSNSIEKVLLSTDYVPNALIEELTDSGNCKVFTHYGMTEMGLGGGVECEALKGYHLREADLYFEVVSPATGRKVKDGEYGEIVFTTLTRKGMPLIRYRTGDKGRFSAKACDCGTVLRTMDRILGRIENKVEIYDGNFLNMRDIDENLIKIKELMNYEVSVMDNSKSQIYNKKEGKLYNYRENNIEEKSELVITAYVSKENFEVVKDEIVRNLNQIPVISKSIKKGILEIKILLPDREKESGNGTLKRRIYDYRREYEG